MKTRNWLFVSLAWLQLVISLLMATTIVWGYLGYRATMGQFIQSVATSIGTVSTVVVGTAQTLEARRDYLNEMGKLLATLRVSVTVFSEASKNQEQLVPQYAASMRSASNVAGSLSGALQSTGERLRIQVPSGVRMEGVKPVLVMSHPFDDLAQNLLKNAQDIKIISANLSTISDSISSDGQKMGAAISASAGQALKVIAETEKTLERLKAQELPKALADLRSASENLRDLSSQVDVVGNVGVALLIVGLLLSAWCFLNSLGSLFLLSPIAAASREG